MSPTASSGILEVHNLDLGRPFPPYTDLLITSGDIPPLLSPPHLHSDSAEDENGGGGSGNIDEEDPHNVVQSVGREYSNISTSITVEDPGSEAHQEDVIGGSGSGDIIEGEGGIQAVAYEVEDFLLVSAERVQSSSIMLSLIPEKKYLSIIVLLLVAVLDLVAVMTWLWLTDKFVQGNISAPLTTAPLTTPITTMFWPTMSPTLRLVLRPYLIPQKCFTETPLLQLSADDAKDRDEFGISVSVFGVWSIVGFASYKNVKGGVYLYRRFWGAGMIVK